MSRGRAGQGPKGKRQSTPNGTRNTEFDTRSNLRPNPGDAGVESNHLRRQAAAGREIFE